MAIGTKDAAVVKAFDRFGFGARPGGLAEAAGDPRGFLLEEVWGANAALVSDGAPPSGQQALQAYYLQQEGVREERAKMAAAAMQTAALAPTASAMSGAASASAPPAPAASPAVAKAEPPAAPPEPQKPMPTKPPVQQAQFVAEAEARLAKQLEARAGFVERLVAFWSNHFAVSAAKSPELRALSGPFEREAIRAASCWKNCGPQTSLSSATALRPRALRPCRPTISNSRASARSGPRWPQRRCRPHR